MGWAKTSGQWIDASSIPESASLHSNSVPLGLTACAKQRAPKPGNEHHNQIGPFEGPT